MELENMIDGTTNDQICVKCEELSAMNVQKRRKTRRGKRKPYRLDTVNNTGGNFSESSLYLQNQILIETNKYRKFNKPMLRTPVSPKAPLNSTQFLIEDRQDYIVSFDESAYLGLPSPDQMLTEGSEMQDPDHSFYEETFEKEEKSQDSKQSDEYIPLEETAEFMGREFEREFEQLQQSSEILTKSQVKNDVLKGYTKDEIINKLIELETKYKELSFSDSDYRPILDGGLDLSLEMRSLSRENLHLKRENERLRQILKS